MDELGCDCARRETVNDEVILKRIELGFVVRPGIINRQAAKIFGDFNQSLIVLVPFGGRLVEHHDALKSKSELDESGLTKIRAQPAGVFEVLVAGEVGVREALDHSLE